MSLGVRGLVFVGTRTPEAAAMTAFARDVLGLAPRDRGGGDVGDHGGDDGDDDTGGGDDDTGGDDDGGAAYFDLPDGSSFAVQQTGASEPAERTVGLLVDDLDAAAAHLQAAGVATDEVSESATQRWAHFRAPDGRLYELVQQR